MEGWLARKITIPFLDAPFEEHRIGIYIHLKAFSSPDKFHFKFSLSKKKNDKNRNSHNVRSEL